MSKGTNQKLKLYYLAKIMTSKTDEEHLLTMPEIIQALEEYGVTADRKSIYDDMEALRILGIDVIGEKIGRNYFYHVGSKQFEIAELKLLVDAIQSSRFITEKKSADLIRKVTSLASDYEALQLKRQVTVQGRIKTMNESIYYNVDVIHSAISKNRTITLEYLRWDIDKQLVPRKEDSIEISPWALLWAEENYYLIAYDAVDAKIKHYRVDKMRKITLTDTRREGKEHFRSFDLGAYSRMVFGMYGGEEERVTIRFRESMIGILVDRFGKDIPVRKTDSPDWYETSVKVALSDQFYGWIFGLGPNVRIAGPESAVERFSKELKNLSEIYND